MIEVKQKYCKGTGNAKGYGCKKLVYKRTYGLCSSCYKYWLLNTPEGSEKLQKTQIRAKKKVEKESKPRRKYTKWKEKPLNEMIQYVQFEIVNKYIKLRDSAKFGRCISSDNAIIDAGHYYPTTISKLRFNIANIHGQNHSDNRFKSGNLAAYKEGLIRRHGQKYFNTLERLKLESINWPKLDKIELIKIGITYEYLTKKMIWCFNHEEFENYKHLINK